MYLDTGAGTNGVHVGGASNPVNILDQAAAGIDHINVGSDGTLTTLTAPVNITQTSNTTATIALNIDDAWDSSARAFTINRSGVSVSGLATSVNFQAAKLSSLFIEDPWYEDNTINLMGLPSAINGVTVFSKGTNDSVGATPWQLIPDIWFTHPVNWRSPFELPNELILFNPS